MKDVIIQGALAAVGLFLAYNAYTYDDTQTGGEETVVVNCSADGVTEVALTKATRDVVVSRSEGEELFKVTENREVAKKKSKTTYTGGAGVTELLEAVAPLKAVRDLGVLSEDELEAVSLKDSKETFSLTCAGKKHTFTLGGSAFGTGDRYVHSDKGSPVYLIPNAIIRDLEAAESQLMQRALTSFENGDAESLDLTAFGTTKVLKQVNRKTPHAAKWVDAAAPEKLNELFGNWVSRLYELKAQRYTQGEPGSTLKPVPGATIEVTPIATVTFKDDKGASLAKIEFKRADGSDTPAYYAHSDATNAWVRLPASSAKDFESDTRTVLGLPPLEASAVPSKTAPPTAPAKDDVTKAPPKTP